MKVNKIVAAIIIHGDRTFAIQRGYKNFLESVDWLPADLDLIKKLKDYTA